MKLPFHQKAIFLDRDGVINRELGDYCTNLRDFKILPTIIEAMKTWYDQGYLLVVVTNQGGIAKARYTRQDVEAIHQYLKGVCVFNGFRIKEVFYCPHHTEVTGKCLCRKPGRLLFEKAIEKYRIDITGSFMIGDHQRDMDAARSCGIKSILINSNTEVNASIID